MNRVKRQISKLIFLSLCGIILGSTVLSAEVSVPVDLVDIPTTEILDAQGYTIGLRLYENGGMITRLVFGVITRINLGLSWDIERVIGRNTIAFHDPRLYFKWRFYDGSKTFPSLALGYDAQGYYYDSNTKKYSYREKGVYFVAGKEVLPNLQFVTGANVYDLERMTTYLFLGANYMMGDTVGWSLELDNIHNSADIRLNLGFKIYFTPNLNLGISVRDFAQDRSADRMLYFGYEGNIRRR